MIARMLIQLIPKNPNKTSNSGNNQNFLSNILDCFRSIFLDEVLRWPGKRTIFFKIIN